MDKTFLKPLSIAVLASILLGTAGCGPHPATGGLPGGAGGPPPEVAFITIAPETLPVTTELPGRLDAVRIAQVRARVAGILQKRLFTEGAEVKAGEVLFQIDPAPLQAAYNSAKATLAKAEAGLKQTQAKADRYKVLVEYNAVSKQDYADAVAGAAKDEADILAGKAAVETASLNLGYASVTAPIAGRIGKALVTEGALVGQNEATELAVIQQLDPIYFDFTQSSADVLRLRRALENGSLKSLAPGEAKVNLVLEDGSVYPQPGKLLFSDISVDPTTGMITLRAEVPNPERWLLPGMFVRGRLEQAINRDTIAVPQRAVAWGPGGEATVLALKADNTVESRVIHTETAAGDKWLVTSGLRAGDRVIVEGLQKVRPAMAVKPVPFTGDPNNASAPAQNQGK
jgi:membrane fusion protein, multidrug efflux system